MGNFLLPFSYSFKNFGIGNQRRRVLQVEMMGEKTRKQREEVNVLNFISYTALGLSRSMQLFSMK